MTLVLNNAQVFRSGVFSRNDVSVSLGGGVSRAVSPVCVDASSFVVLPGFVDVHVHLREPGFSYKETIRSGSLAAAARRLYRGVRHAQPEPGAGQPASTFRSGAGRHPPGRRDPRPVPTAPSPGANRARSWRTWPPWPPMWRASPTTAGACSPTSMMRRAMERGQAPGQADRGPLRGQCPCPRGGCIHDGALCQGPRPSRASAPRASGGPIERDLRAGAGDGLPLSRLPHLHQGEPWR